MLASTATVYRRSQGPLTEDSPSISSSLYATSKRSAELICEAYAGLVPCTALRLFTLRRPRPAAAAGGRSDRRRGSASGCPGRGKPRPQARPLYVGDAAAACGRQPRHRPGPHSRSSTPAAPSACPLGRRRVSRALRRDLQWSPEVEREPEGLVPGSSRARALRTRGDCLLPGGHPPHAGGAHQAAVAL